jgi:alkylated DNA repair dioxygenase AlkB
MASKPMHPCLLQLLDFMNSKFNYCYNGILINKYIGGEDYISAHSDDERGLDTQVGVVAISYGAVRTFRIRNKDNGQIVVNVPTNSAKILQMAGDFQKEFTHEIPVEKKITGTRFSFTFRRHLT